MDAGSRGREPLAHLSRDGAETCRLHRAHEFHPRRTPAHHGASVLRLMGISDDRILRADFSLWHAAGFYVFRGLPASARDRRNFGLGSVALSLRRARTRLLRW